MSFKCQQCNKNNISFFPGLAGQNICNECQNQLRYRRNNGLCIECGTSQNIFFSGRCEKCNKLWLKKELVWQKGIVTKKQKKGVDEKKSYQETSEVLKDDKEAISTILKIAFFLFIIWMLFGGYLENQNYGNKIYIDCRLQENENNMYCNGEYESRIQEEDYRESNFPR